MGARAGRFVSMGPKTGRRHPRGTMVRGGPKQGGVNLTLLRGVRLMGNPTCHAIASETMFLVRDLVSPRTWLAMISHLAGLGHRVSRSSSSLPSASRSASAWWCSRWSACRSWGVTLRFAEWFATAERARLGFLLGVRIPALARWELSGAGRVTGGASWPRWRMFTERATWSEIGYGLLRAAGQRGLPRRSASRPGPRGPGHADAAAVQLVAAQRAAAKIGGLRASAARPGMTALGGDRPAGAAGLRRS